MKKVIVLLVTVILLLIPLTTYADSGIGIVGKTGNGTWADNTWNVSLYPGETRSTTIALRNSSSETLEVEASVIPISFDNSNLVFELDKSTFEIPSSAYSNVTLVVRANGSLTPGQYSAELVIKSEVSEVTPTPTPTVIPMPTITPYIPYIPYIPEWVLTPTPTASPVASPQNTVTVTPIPPPVITTVIPTIIPTAPLATTEAPTITPVPYIGIEHYWSKNWLWLLLLIVPLVIGLVVLIGRRK